MATNLFVPRGRRGFTLAEMLIVMVIIAIAAGMAAPRVQGMVRASSLTGAVNRVAADLQLARVRAIRSGRPVALVVADGGTTYTVVEDPTGTPTQIKRVVLSRDYPGVALSPAPTSVGFDSRGMLQASAERTLTGTHRSGHRATLTLSGVGRIYRDQ